MQINIFHKAVKISLRKQRFPYKALKHSLSKECIQGISFLWQTQIQTTKYGLYDMVRIKKYLYRYCTHLHRFTPSDLNFQTILMPKVILAKKLSQNSWSFGTILIFRTSMAIIIYFWNCLYKFLFSFSSQMEDLKLGKKSVYPSLVIIRNLGSQVGPSEQPF